MGDRGYLLILNLPVSTGNPFTVILQTFGPKSLGGETGHVLPSPANPPIPSVEEVGCLHRGCAFRGCGEKACLSGSVLRFGQRISIQENGRIWPTELGQ